MGQGRGICYDPKFGIRSPQSLSQQTQQTKPIKPMIDNVPIRIPQLSLLLRNLLSLRSSLLASLLIIAFQVAFDESLEIAIKHCVHISRFYVCAMVFHHSVGMKNIRSNLASPLNLF